MTERNDIETWEERLRHCVENVELAAEHNDNVAALALSLAGLENAQSWELLNPEAPSDARLQIPLLSLFEHASALQQVSRYYQDGLDQALSGLTLARSWEIFNVGIADKNLQTTVLRLLELAAEAKESLDDFDGSFNLANEGLLWSRNWGFLNHEAIQDSSLTYTLLNLFAQAVVGSTLRGDLSFARELADEGLSLAWSFDFMHQNITDYPLTQSAILGLFFASATEREFSGHYNEGLDMAKKGLLWWERWGKHSCNPRLQAVVLRLIDRAASAHNLLNDFEGGCKSTDAGLTLVRDWGLLNTKVTDNLPLQIAILQLFDRSAESRGCHNDHNGSRDIANEGLSMALDWQAKSKARVSSLYQSIVLKLFTRIAIAFQGLGEYHDCANQANAGLKQAQDWGALNPDITNNMEVQISVISLFLTEALARSVIGDHSGSFDLENKAYEYAQRVVRHGGANISLFELIQDYSFRTDLLNQQYFLISCLNLALAWQVNSTRKAIHDSDWARVLARRVRFEGFYQIWRNALTTWLEEWTVPDTVFPANGRLALDCAHSLLLQDIASQRSEIKTLLANTKLLLSEMEKNLLGHEDEGERLFNVLSQSIKDMGFNVVQNAPFEKLVESSHKSLDTLSWWQRLLRQDKTLRNILQQIMSWQNSAPSLDVQWRHRSDALEKGICVSLSETLIRCHPSLNLIQGGPHPALAAILRAHPTFKVSSPEQALNDWCGDSSVLDFPVQDSNLWRKMFCESGAWEYCLCDIEPDIEHTEKLLPMLARAWSDAANAARTLGGLLTILQGPNRPDFAHLLPDHSAIPDALLYRSMVAAILGNIKTVLQDALRDWLRYYAPMPENGAPLSTVLYCWKIRLSEVIAVHPGPRLNSVLAERVHNWSQRHIGQLLQTNNQMHHTGIEELSLLLEYGRVALVGQAEELSLLLEYGRVALIGQAFEFKPHVMGTAYKTNLEMIADGVVSPARAFENMLTIWLGLAAEFLPAPPALQACQAQLALDEAIVQLFFDPITQGLKALWTTPQFVAQLHTLPKGTALEAWQPLLTNWQASFNNLDADSMDRVWPRFCDGDAIKALATAFIEGSKSNLNKPVRLTVFWPAELSQLPWEGLDIFRANGLRLQRAVSLTSWLQQRKNANIKGDATILYAQNDATLHFRWQDAVQAGDYWSTRPPPLTPQDGRERITSYDVIRHLNQYPHAHLIMHGKYVPYDPHNSYLLIKDPRQPDKHERLPAWLLGASNPSKFVLLAACETAVSGQAVKGLLGPVGIAPLLVGAGAQVVIGTLWRCDHLASLLFNHYLYDAAHHAEVGITTWLDCVENAKSRLRDMHYAEFVALLRVLFKDEISNQLGVGEMADDEAIKKIFRSDDYISIYRLISRRHPPEHPFSQPFFWAPFVLLGNGNLFVKS